MSVSVFHWTARTATLSSHLPLVSMSVSAASFTGLLGMRRSALLPDLVQSTLGPLADHRRRVRRVAFKKLVALETDKWSKCLK